MRTRNKTVSAVGSELKEKIEIGQSTSQLARWYYTIYNNRSSYRRAPTSLPFYKQSHPYCLTISKIQGLTVNKKNTNSSVFLNFSGMLVTESFDVLGIPFNFQFEESLGRNESKWEVPLSFYFHSRIDKNYPGLFLMIKVRALQIKDGVVEGLTNIGTLVIESPFIEVESQTVSIIKELNQVDFAFMSLDAKTKVLKNVSQITVQYSVQSVLQLKKLIKVIPENSIVSYQNQISGIKGNYILREGGQFAVKQGNAVQLTISYLQVHVSQKFDQDLLNHLKKLLPKLKIGEIKNRKLVLGYHNQYCLVNPSTRKLEFVDKEIAGQMKVNIYESLKEGEVLKVPFYVDKNICCGVIAVGLIYEINQKEYEVACYYFLPSEKGEDISENMIIGGGYGALYQMVQIPTGQKPTILLEYSSDFNQNQTSTELQDQQIISSRNYGAKNMIDEQALAREKQKLKEEIEKERLQIMKEKQEMEKAKNENYLSFQAEFEKKFEAEKESLFKKQQMIENQYKEQVQREIRAKFELEEEIKKMTDKLKNIEEENFKRIADSSQPISDADPFSSSPKMLGKQGANSMPMPRQRVDPSYIIQPQNPVPVKKVREIIEKGPKVNSQLIQLSQQQFNYASKFTFSFISIVWSADANPPKTIYFVIRFFNQEQFRSDNISYLESGQGRHHQLVRTNYFMKGLEGRQPTYTFVIDPSHYHQPHILQKDLIAYLATNSAIVDVFCGESHLYIGQINIKMKQLIRGAKSQTLMAKEFNLVRLKSKEQLGVMQILIKNEQVNCKDEVSLKDQKKVKELKKKVVSNNPIFISSEDKMLSSRYREGQRGEPIKAKAASSSRQQMRIQKYKEQKAMKTFTQTAQGFSHLQQSEKGTVLNQILNYKQKKMEDYLKGVYANLLNEQINVTAHFGKAVTFPFLFQNTSQYPSSYKVSIMSIGEENNQELTLIKGNKEWRFFVVEHEPKRYDMIGENNTFFLHPGESIPLIFKFLSFSKEKKSNQDLQKIVNVTICKQDNNWIAGGFSLYVQMHQPVVHHSYILYQPGDQIVDIIVPVIYSQTDNTSNPKRLYLTDPNPNSTAQWLNPYQILVRVQTPRIMQKIKFNLLLYNDQYFCELVENWLVEIHAYEGVCSYFRSDFNTKFKITMPWSVVPAHLGLLSLDRAQSCLKLYASSAALIFKENIIQVDSDKRNEGGCQIWCELMGSENTRKNAEITCISAEDSELIYGWTVTVYPYMPRT